MIFIKIDFFSWNKEIVWGVEWDLSPLSGCNISFIEALVFVLSRAPKLRVANCNSRDIVRLLNEETDGDSLLDVENVVVDAALGRFLFLF